jgi:hypothetical protein
VLASSDGTIAALAVDQRNALRSLFARAERRSGVGFERKLTQFDERVEQSKNIPQEEYARFRFTPLDWRRLARPHNNSGDVACHHGLEAHWRAQTFAE